MYWIYAEMNLELKPSPFLKRIDLVRKSLTKFRLGSHSLKIETGRWNRTKRTGRLCRACGELGDELHALYRCSEVYREDLENLPANITDIWECDEVNTLFQRMRVAEMVD